MVSEELKLSVAVCKNLGLQRYCDILQKKTLHSFASFEMGKKGEILQNRKNMEATDYLSFQKVGLPGIASATEMICLGK